MELDSDDARDSVVSAEGKAARVGHFGIGTLADLFSKSQCRVDNNR